MAHSAAVGEETLPFNVSLNLPQRNARGGYSRRVYSHQTASSLRGHGFGLNISASPPCWLQQVQPVACFLPLAAWDPWGWRPTILWEKKHLEFCSDFQNGPGYNEEGGVGDASGHLFSIYSVCIWKLQSWRCALDGDCGPRVVGVRQALIIGSEPLHEPEPGSPHWQRLAYAAG